jgi:hypothetical protein
MGVPELRLLFRATFGQDTASNNSAWLRKKLAEPPANEGARRRVLLLRASPAARSTTAVACTAATPCSRAPPLTANARSLPFLSLTEGGARRAAQPRARDMTASIWTRGEGGPSSPGKAPEQGGGGGGGGGGSGAGGVDQPPPQYAGASGFGGSFGGMPGTASAMSAQQRAAAQARLLAPRIRPDPCLAEAQQFITRRVAPGTGRDDEGDEGDEQHDALRCGMPRWGVKRCVCSRAARRTCACAR